MDILVVDISECEPIKSTFIEASGSQTHETDPTFGDNDNVREELSQNTPKDKFLCAGKVSPRGSVDSFTNASVSMQDENDVKNLKETKASFARYEFIPSKLRR